MKTKKLAAAFLALTVLAGCSSSNGNTSDSGDSEKLETKAITLYGDDELVPVGTPITIDDVTYTLESAKTETIGTQDYEYCFVRIENNSSKPIDYAWVDWYMRQSGDDAMLSLDAMMTDPTALDTDTLDPGDDTCGYLIYEVKANSELVLEPPREIGEEGEMWLVRTYD